MGRLTYGMLVSLDGYVRAADGDFDWTEPDPVLHEHFNEVQRRTTVDIYGRQMWETMRYWQDPPSADLEAPEYRGFAEAWRATDTIVVSSSLPSLDAPRAVLWSELDPDRLRALVEAADGDVAISGPTLAAAALRAGLIDEITAYVIPHVAGGGLRFLPDGYGTTLRLRNEHLWPGGVVQLAYDVLHDEGGTS